MQFKQSALLAQLSENYNVKDYTRNWLFLPFLRSREGVMCGISFQQYNGAQAAAVTVVSG